MTLVSPKDAVAEIRIVKLGRDWLAANDVRLMSGLTGDEADVICLTEDGEVLDASSLVAAGEGNVSIVSDWVVGTVVMPGTLPSVIVENSAVVLADMTEVESFVTGFMSEGMIPLPDISSKVVFDASPPHSSDSSSTLPNSSIFFSYKPYVRLSQLDETTW